jgi:hypothetical protein
MKKILLLFFGLLATGSVSAQQYIFGPISDYRNGDFYTAKIGLEFGVNISKTINSYDADFGTSASTFTTSALRGFNAGMTFDVPIAYPVSFAPEILYSQTGYKAITSDGNYTQRNQFVNIPLLAKYHVGSIVSFYAGPQFSILAVAKNTYDSGFVTANEHYYINNGGTTSFDGVFGVSLDLIHHVDLHARYTISLQQIESNGISNVPDYRTQVWQIGLGFRL